MMKLSHLLKSRTAVSEKLLPAFTSQAGMSFARPDLHGKSPYAGNRSGSVFADYTVYKGKAALNMSPIMPKFTKLDSGGLKVEKKGVVILSFSPAIGERKYDWEKKQAFALSATEVGSLISLGPGKSCEFFHDPSMKSSNAGQIRKSLSVTPLSPEDTGYFFTLSVVNGIQKTNERFSVPITKAEFAVMRTACSYILPHIMGWDQYANQLPPRSTGVNPVRQSEMRVTMDDEWDR